MKTNHLILIALLFLFPACIQREDPGIDFTCEENQAVCDLAYSNNAFGWDIFQKLHKDDPDANLFISPFSISTAFGMLLNGTRSETREEVLDVMKLNGWTEEDVNNAYKALLEILPALDHQVKFNVANSIWYRDNFVVLDEFLRQNEDHFLSEIRSMDFTDSETKDIINQWIEDQTGGKIKDMIDQINPATVMFLINAIYFYGEWLYEFDEGKTVSGLFYPDNRVPVETDLMTLSEVPLPYYRNSDFEMIDLPYGDSIFSMTILLPRGDNTVDELLEEIDVQALEEAFNSLESVEFSSVVLPKFNIEYKTTLVKTLSDLGMKKVFDPATADLSGIDGNKDLYVSNVIHQSFIEVDEKGTEAAAATVIVIDGSSSSSNSFNANRSFVFAIRDNRTKSVLFLGKLMEP